MKTLIVRSLSGLVYVSLIVFGLLLIPKTYGLSFSLLLLVVLIVSSIEFITISGSSIVQVSRKLLVTVSALLYLSSSLFTISLIQANLLLSVSVLLVLLLFISEMYRKRDFPAINLGVSLLTILYIAVPIILMQHYLFHDISVQQQAIQTVLGFFVLLWLYDSFAYLFGVSFGKNRLFERLSPKKSWEGFIGGSMITLVIAYFINNVFDSLQPIQWLIVSTLIIIGGTFGDLFESMLKRSFEVKDSGNILPGHGGLLDRFDAMFFAFPLVYIYLLFF